MRPLKPETSAVLKHTFSKNILKYLSKISILFEITFERIEARFSLDLGQYILSQSSQVLRLGFEIFKLSINLIL